MASLFILPIFFLCHIGNIGTLDQNIREYDLTPVKILESRHRIEENHKLLTLASIEFGFQPLDSLHGGRVLL